MIITPDNLQEREPDDILPNIVNGLKSTLLDIDEIKGITIKGQTRKTVSSKIMNRIHSFIKMSKGDYMVDLNDIITYMDNVNYVNKTALPIIYKAVTGQELPPIVMEAHLLKKFVTDGLRSLESDEKTFFKTHYHASAFFLRKPSFSGSSVVALPDMKMYAQIEKFTTDFDDLLTYIERKGDIMEVSEGFFMSRKSHKAETFVKSNIEATIKPMVTNESHIIIDPKYSEEQQNAIRSCMTSDDRINCLTGPAGSGKTLVISSIVDNAYANGKHIACCAFTGKAASRMEQSEVDVSKIIFPPKTIHSLMATLKMQTATDIDLIIIDEASTMHSELFCELIQVLEKSSTLEKIKFLFVGDANQLPPIGGGQIFEDIITLDIYPTYRLTKIFRTTDPAMLDLYNAVLDTNLSVNMNKHKKFFKTYNPQNVGPTMEKLVELLFAKDEKWYKDNKCCILTHTNKYCDYINYLCYKKLTGKSIEFYDYTFDDHPGDMEPAWEPIPVFWKGAKIIFTKNDKIDVKKNGEEIRVTNGTVADVVDIIEGLILVKSYDDGRSFYISPDYDTVKLAYAMTVYKSQGSEAQHIIYIHSNHIFESKRLAYTAMTRARANLKIFTPTDGFRMAKDVPRFTDINSH